MCNGVRATWLSTSCKRTGRKLVTTSPGVPRGHFLWTERSPLSDCREPLHGFRANPAFWRKQSKILLQKHLETCTESFIIMEIGKGSVAVATNYSVALERILREFSFETLFLPAEASELYVTSQDVNRPGLLLAGRDDYFDPARIQILGLSEMEFLKTKTQHEQAQALERLTSRKPAGILITRDLACPEDLLSLCKTYGVPLLRTGESTSSCMSALIYFLGTELAERVTRHGVLVEVYGEGVLIVGDSGVGKSETAIELIKRGHRLIADDAVEIRRVSAKALVGSAPDNIRHFIEVRGIGIINARRIFGMGAVKLTEKIDLVVQLEPWDPEKVYDRMGLDDVHTSIMGVQVPVAVVPVKPGRNLAVIIEVAAMNNRQKKMGYNAARELLQHLGIEEEAGSYAEQTEVW